MTLVPRRSDHVLQCPSCAADVEAFAQAMALGEAVAARAPGDPPPTMVWYSTNDLMSCPRCGAPLPS